MSRRWRAQRADVADGGARERPAPPLGPHREAFGTNSLTPSPERGSVAMEQNRTQSATDHGISGGGETDVSRRNLLALSVPVLAAASMVRPSRAEAAVGDSRLQPDPQERKAPGGNAPPVQAIHLQEPGG